MVRRVCTLPPIHNVICVNWIFIYCSDVLRASKWSFHYSSRYCLASHEATQHHVNCTSHLTACVMRAASCECFHICLSDHLRPQCKATFLSHSSFMFLKNVALVAKEGRNEKTPLAILRPQKEVPWMKMATLNASPLSAYCCVHFLPHLSHFNQPKALITG
jgi:hypothetical protein